VGEQEGKRGKRNCGTGTYTHSVTTTRSCEKKTFGKKGNGGSLDGYSRDRLFSTKKREGEKVQPEELIKVPDCPA